MKRILLIVLGVVVVGVAVVVLLSVKTGRELTPLAAGILREIAEGHADDVHASASERFRKETALADFRRWAEYRRRALGAFVRVVKTTGAGVSTSVGAGTEGKVSLDLEYERGQTTCEVHFVKVDGVWKLLGLQVEVPEEIGRTPDRARLEPLSLEALGLLANGDLVALYQRFSPELQTAWPPEKFESDMRGFLARMGAMEDPVTTGTEDLPEGTVATTFDVGFANGPATARLEWVWRHATWDLLGFSVRSR